VGLPGSARFLQSTRHMPERIPSWWPILVGLSGLVALLVSVPL
jgi:hypothetical protein